MATMNTMRAEWRYWSTQANILQELCKEKNIRIPRRRSKNMSIDTLQLLQRVLHRIREEVNRISMDLNRYYFCQLTTECAEDGFMHEAEFYLNTSREEQVLSDVEISDEE
ncbi:hypothetical protein ACSBR1_023662 [Camellia fascicularis]